MPTDLEIAYADQDEPFIRDPVVGCRLTPGVSNSSPRDELPSIAPSDGGLLFHPSTTHQPISPLRPLTPMKTMTSNTELCPRCGQPGRLHTYPHSGQPPQQDCHRCIGRFKTIERRRTKFASRKAS